MREFKDLKIAVAGTGYVGLSIATLLSQHHQQSCLLEMQVLIKFKVLGRASFQRTSTKA